MKRRQFLSAATATFGETAWVPGAFAQVQAEPRRIGWLRIGSAAAGANELAAFRNRLRELGHVEGRDVVIDMRWAEGRTEALPHLAGELAALKPSVIVTGGSLAAQAVLNADPAVPIVILIGDAVGAGLAAELKRPAARITGISFIASSLDAKRLEYLAEVLPRGAIVMNLADPNARGGSEAKLAETARSLGVTPHTIAVRTPDEIDAAFVSARRLRVAGVNVLSSAFLNANRRRIIDLAAASRLASIFQWPESAEDGGLIGYGPRFSSLSAQLATYASRIVRGAKPSELPIEQPTQFELVINGTTARTIGVAIPASLRLRADQVLP